MERHHHHDQCFVQRRPGLSQHFLRDARAVREMVAGMRLPRGLLVVEPGAGCGIITEALADAGCRVIAVEKDPRLFRRLRSRFIGRTNIECHRADFLTFTLPRERYVVVSNVPFAITAEIVRKLLDAPRPPDDAYLIVQREAAERFAGIPHETRVALLYKPWFEFRIVRELSPGDFFPAPSVDTVLMRIHHRVQPLVALRERSAYRAFVLATFGSTRQRARHALRSFFTERQLVRLARELGIARDARPSQITLGQWLGLYRFHAAGRLGRDPASGGHAIPADEIAQLLGLSR